MDKEKRDREHEEICKVLNSGWKGSDDDDTTDDGFIYDDDDDDDDGRKKKHDDTDFFPVTSTAEEQRRLIDNNLNPVLLAMIDRHRKIFMAKAFPPVQEDAADYMLWCRPQAELDYIIHVLNNWQEGVRLKEVPPGPERDRLAKFR